jgi:methyltransferase (TIGR00027 family)
MADKTKWAALVAGVGCPMDVPRPASNDHWDLVGQLSVSSLYLTKNQTYRGQCQLIFDSRHVARVDQLSQPEWTSLAADLFTAQQAITRIVTPDHVNVESLGNVVPHLHWHIIPRYVGDAMWGAPIWRVPLDSMPDTRLPEDERTRLIAQLQKALAGPVTDMTGVGLTARWMAANRALESDHASPLYRDAFARDLAGEAGFDVLYAMRTASGMGTFSGPDPYLTIRTRFFDDALLSAVRESSIDQVVILAAGMDARAFRLEWPAGLRLFEVDREDVFIHKERVLARLQAKPSCDRRVVQQDLSQSWASALVDAGFNRKRKAAFLAEGLLYYLDEAAVTSMFEVLRGTAAPGSWMGVDTMSPEMLTSPFMAAYLKRLAQLGCPWKFSVADPEAFMAARGWQADVVLPGETDANFGRWALPVMPRAIPGMPRTFLMRAMRVAD